MRRTALGFRFITTLVRLVAQYANHGSVGAGRGRFHHARTFYPAPPPRTSYLLVDMDRNVRREAARRARVAPVGHVRGMRQCPHCGTDLPPLAFIDRCRVCGERPGRRA